jgi:plastocyanin
MKRRRILAVVVALLVAAAVMIPAAQGASGATVKVVNNKFKPGNVKVRKGGKVTWKFKQGRHNVVGPGFSSPIKRSGKWSKRFKRKGTFKYVCTLHPGMDGRVKVR